MAGYKVGKLEVKKADSQISASLRAFAEDSLKGFAPLQRQFYSNYRLWRGKSMGNEKRNRATIVASDAFDTVQWIMPDLLDIFSGNIFRVTSEQDPDNAVILEDVINNLFNEAPNGFMTKYHMFIDGLIFKFGVAKSYVRIKDSVQTIEIPRVSPDEFNAIINDPYLKSKVDYNVSTIPDRATGIPTETFTNVKYKRLDTSQREMKTDVLPIDEYRFSSLLDDEGNPFFQAHAKVVSMDWLRRRQREKDEDGNPFFRNVDELDAGISPYMKSYIQSAYAEDGLPGIRWEDYEKYDDALKMTEIWECHVKLDVNNDGFLEDVIVWMNYQDGKILRVQENTQGNIFTRLTNCPDPHKFGGIAVVEQVSDLTKIRTAIMRHYIENLARVNDGVWRVNPDAHTALADILANHGFIRGREKDIDRIPPSPLDDTVLKALTFFAKEREHKVGLASQPVDIKDLKSTEIGSQGIMRLMRASSKRVRMIAQIYAESGLTDIAHVYLNLAKKFIVPNIDPGVIFKASCTIGATELDREDTLRKMDYLLKTAIGLMSKGLPVTDPARIYNILSEISTAMGYAPRKFWTPPQERGFIPGYQNQKGMMGTMQKIAGGMQEGQK